MKTPKSLGINSSDPVEIAEALFDMGYRQVSRKFKEIARVDMSDAELRQFFIRNNFGNATSGIPSCTMEGQRDFYRRVHSRDKLTVSEPIMAHLRKLSG